VKFKKLYSAVFHLQQTWRMAILYWTWARLVTTTLTPLQQPPYVQNCWLPLWGPYQYPPQQPRQPEPHKIKLADFWTHQPQVSIIHTEALFSTYSVVEEQIKFNLVLPTLSQDTLVRVAMIVNAPQLLAEPYTALGFSCEPWVWAVSVFLCGSGWRGCGFLFVLLIVLFSLSFSPCPSSLCPSSLLQ